MRTYFIAFAILLLAACGNNEGKKEATDTALEAAGELSATPADSFCYIRTAGTKQQDTAAIKLYVIGNSVTGKMMYLPYEKDWRLGNLSGRKQGNTITAKWVFMQEGMLDSFDVILNLSDDKLVEQSGDTDYEYSQIDCAAFPAYDFDFGMGM